MNAADPRGEAKQVPRTRKQPSFLAIPTPSSHFAAALAPGEDGHEGPASTLPVNLAHPFVFFWAKIQRTTLCPEIEKSIAAGRIPQYTMCFVLPAKRA